MEKKLRKKQVKPVTTASSKSALRNEEAAEAQVVNPTSPVYELPAQAEQPNPVQLPNLPVAQAPIQAPIHMMPNMPVYQAPMTHMMPTHHANPQPYGECHPCQQHVMMHHAPQMALPGHFPGLGPAPAHTAPIWQGNPNPIPYPEYTAPVSMNPAPMPYALPQQMLPVSGNMPHYALPYAENPNPQLTAPISNVPNMPNMPNPALTLPIEHTENQMPMASPFELQVENENPAFELPFSGAFPHAENIEPDYVNPITQTNKPNSKLPEATYAEVEKKIKPWVDRGIEEGQSVGFPYVLTETSIKSYLSGKGYDDQAIESIVETWKKEERF